MSDEPNLKRLQSENQALRQRVSQLERQLARVSLDADDEPLSDAERLTLHHREEQLHQARKMEAIGQLSGGIAHDFNNLLMVLLGGTERLRRGGDPTECLDDIEAAARSAASLTQRLLAFSRKAVVAPTLVDLSHVVDEIRPLITRTIGEHILTRFEHPRDPLVVRVFPSLTLRSVSRKL
jgi:C4-dicarboxylate-specific signal transduction histidine kinase